MSNILNVSGSYLQENKHAIVSSKFNVITPAAVGQVMADNGLTLAALQTGRGRHEDKKDFQRTISRYRGAEILPGINLDVLHESKHMGRGVDRLMIGVYRLICTNGLFLGTNFFKFEIRHSGDTYETLATGVRLALEKQQELTDLIRKMQGVVLNDEQRKFLIDSAVGLLVPAGAVNIKSNLTHVRRAGDAGEDLFTVFNRIQENAVQGGSVSYDLVKTDETTGRNTVRHMTNRRIKANTGRDAEFNQALFDAAAKLAA